MEIIERPAFVFIKNGNMVYLAMQDWDGTLKFKHNCILEDFRCVGNVAKMRNNIYIFDAKSNHVQEFYQEDFDVILTIKSELLDCVGLLLVDKVGEGVVCLPEENSIRVIKLGRQKFAVPNKIYAFYEPNIKKLHVLSGDGYMSFDKVEDCSLPAYNKKGAELKFVFARGIEKTLFFPFIENKLFL